MAENKPKRRWLRFSLRTLLALVTLAAVASWAYWFGWPWWLAYLEQSRFEADARQLNVNTPAEELSKFMYSHHGDCPGLVLNTNGIHHTFSQYHLKSASYFINEVFWTSPSGEYRIRPLDSIRLFRVPHDQAGKLQEILMGMRPGQTENDAHAVLVYSDPPTAELKRYVNAHNGSPNAPVSDNPFAGQEEGNK